MEDNKLLIIALITVVLSAIGFFMASGFLNSLIQLGPSPQQGVAQVEIVSVAEIVFTYASIDWGKGFVTSGESAVLNTFTGTQTFFNDQPGNPGSVLDENNGFVIENTGNELLTMSFNIANPMNTWFPPGVGSPAVLEFRLDDCFGANPGCTHATQINPVADTGVACTLLPDVELFTPITTTPDTVCTRFEFADATDEMRIDLRLTLPSTLDSTPTANTNNFVAVFSAV